MGTLAKRLEEAMTEAGLNQAELAKRASTKAQPVTQQNVQQLLSGRNRTSKHLPALAKALGLNLHWLATGEGEKRGQREALLIGKVGAGAEVHRLDDPDVLEAIPLPPGLEAPNAAKIEGDSMYPLREGWIILYGPENLPPDPDHMLGKLCVVQVKDGPVLIKVLQKGTRKNLYRLESWNSTAWEDVKVEWAALVREIRII